MPDSKKEYEVTVARTGVMRVFANSMDEAMSLANAHNSAYVRWDDGHSATDAQEVKDGPELPDPLHPDVIGTWRPNDTVWFLYHGGVACGRVKQVSMRPDFDDVVHVAVLNTLSFDDVVHVAVLNTLSEGHGMEGKIVPMDGRLLFRTQTALNAALEEYAKKKE